MMIVSNLKFGNYAYYYISFSFRYCHCCYHIYLLISLFCNSPNRGAIFFLLWLVYLTFCCLVRSCVRVYIYIYISCCRYILVIVISVSMCVYIVECILHSFHQ